MITSNKIVKIVDRNEVDLYKPELIESLSIEIQGNHLIWEIAPKYDAHDILKEIQNSVGLAFYVDVTFSESKSWIFIIQTMATEKAEFKILNSRGDEFKVKLFLGIKKINSTKVLTNQ
jgi:hypothetical protein